MKPQATERIANLFSGIIESSWIWGIILIGEIEIAHAVNGNNMDVTVRNLEAGNHQPHFNRPESLLERLSHSMADRHQVLSQVWLQINPVVHFFPRHHEGVARFGWIDKNPTARSSRQTNRPGISPFMIRVNTVGTVSSCSMRLGRVDSRCYRTT
jgi:hypothetical protein